LRNSEASVAVEMAALVMRLKDLQTNHESLLNRYFKIGFWDGLSPSVGGGLFLCGNVRRVSEVVCSASAKLLGFHASLASSP
jgi:hypothetical protein